MVRANPSAPVRLVNVKRCRNKILSANGAKSIDDIVFFGRLFFDVFKAHIKTPF
jgi:hypothetical protein